MAVIVRRSDLLVLKSKVLDHYDDVNILYYYIIISYCELRESIMYLGTHRVVLRGVVGIIAVLIKFYPWQ